MLDDRVMNLPARPRLAPRVVVTLSMVLGAFASWLAVLGARAHRSGALSDAAIVLALAVSALATTLVSLARDRGMALVAIFGLSVLEVVALPQYGSASTAEMTTLGPALVALLWLGAAPIATLIHRAAPLSTQDSIDRSMLASSLWFVVSLSKTVAFVEHGRAVGGYWGLAAAGLGPAMVSLLALGSLCALAALARSARWMLLWRRVDRTDALRVEPLDAWQSEERVAPETVWFHLWRVESDGVLVRRASSEGSAYRAGEVVTAIARVPMRTGRVMAALALRAAASVALLAAMVAIAMGPLSTLRW